MIKFLTIIVKIYDFASAFAYVVTKFDEWVEQCKTFWKWLNDDGENDPDESRK